MPSLHCHLPSEEERKTPEQDDVINLVGDDNVDAMETEEILVEDAERIVGNAREGQSDDNSSCDDMIHEIDDTSSEASSMINDPTIQPYVPVVSSSSDENESEASFWTPPSTSRGEFEYVSTNAVQQPPRRNTARRSRARQPGATYARRGRYRQPLADQDWYRLSPFERGVTFNGFARNMEPEAVIDHIVDDSRDILYLTKWRNMREAKLIESGVLRTYRPQLVQDYWESLIKRR